MQILTPTSDPTTPEVVEEPTAEIFVDTPVPDDQHTPTDISPDLEVPSEDLTQNQVGNSMRLDLNGSLMRII